ncbi:hypothetical protein A6R68_19849 [Neotoma lepida]|uniref:Uncharacterized protein n=1 Tax=Neotoma lepida TaxID=56216 RepID=A0A1A6HHQ5_NEOLE|nr:hypothetical protein A6R68_19849 [Neotoma lepida]
MKLYLLCSPLSRIKHLHFLATVHMPPTQNPGLTFLNLTNCQKKKSDTAFGILEAPPSISLMTRIFSDTLTHPQKPLFLRTLHVLLDPKIW